MGKSINLRARLQTDSMKTGLTMAAERSILHGADTQLTGDLYQVQNIGDHVFVVLKVMGAAVELSTSALVFHQSAISHLNAIEPSG